MFKYLEIITGVIKEQLLDSGINQSNIHVDFMIGTEDLDTEANTEKGKALVFKNGNFNI
ncbi:MAG: aminopeptidase [Bacilli bacterium]|nr:aminopeptidase [Bacilli bacterium]